MRAKRGGVLSVPSSSTRSWLTPVSSVSGPASLRFRLDLQAGGLPGLETAIEVGHPAVAEPLQRAGGKGGTATRGAVENGAAAGIELGAVIGAGRVSVELEHAAR